MLSDNRTVLNVMSLTVADYQKLKLEDRQKLELVPAFNDYVAKEQGLSLSKTDVDAAISNVRSVLTAISTMSSEDKGIFEKQLQILERRRDESVRVVTGTFQKEAAAIGERLNRVRQFAGLKPELRMTTTFEQTENERATATLTTDVKGYTYSSDHGETVANGYKNMMRAEREMLTAQTRREAVARNTTVYDPKMDAAALIYQFQLQYQSEATARADAGTEEMAQLHRLLSDYAIMQRLVNETLKFYNPKETDEKRRFLNIGGKDDGSVQTEQRAESNQNFFIRYRWDDNTFVDVASDGADGQTGIPKFDEGPRFHWYQLAGTYKDSRIGPGYLSYYDDNGDLKYIDRDNNGAYGEVYTYFGDSNVAVKTGGLNETEMRIVGMFSKDPWGSGQKFQFHPLEAYYGIENRPMSLLSDDGNKGKGGLGLQRRDYWDKWSTQLSDTVTILNQKNQLKQNEIDNDSKQGNRHFDLGNNALKKMNEMLMSIGRM